MTTASLSTKSGPIPAYPFIKDKNSSIWAAQPEQKPCTTKHTATASLYEAT